MNHKGSDKNDYNKALDYSLRLLTLKDRSEADIRNRLSQKGYDERDINKVVERLFLYGYLNEDKLLANLLKVALNEKNYGRHNIKSFLISKGIRKDLIANLSIPDDEYIRSAIQLIHKKRKSSKGRDGQDNTKRLFQLLIRKGHDIETIKKALNSDEALDG